MKTLLRMSGVVKTYGNRTALAGLDLAVPGGAAVGLVGSNGAGKTTALGVAAGYIRPDKGRVDLLGEGPFDARRHRGRVSVLPQDSTLPSHNRVGELLYFYARLQGLPHARARREVEYHLERVHLADRAGSEVRSLSHGMKRRVAIAQAFLGDPELVLLDEPLSGLDPREVAAMRTLLSGLRKRAGLVISSHNLHEIELVCDRVLFIEQGRSVRDDTLREVMGQDREAAFLLGHTPPSLAALRERLPDGSRLEWNERDRILVCRFNDQAVHPSALIRVVIEALYAADAELLEVRRGSGLEKVYLAGTETARPAGRRGPGR